VAWASLGSAIPSKAITGTAASTGESFVMVATRVGWTWHVATSRDDSAFDNLGSAARPGKYGAAPACEIASS
jgi:hypothetical protein